MSILAQDQSRIQITQVYSRCSLKRFPSGTLFRQDCHTSGQNKTWKNTLPERCIRFWLLQEHLSLKIFHQGVESRRKNQGENILHWLSKVWTEKNLCSILSSLFSVLFKASNKTPIFSPTFPCSSSNLVFSASIQVNWAGLS